MSELTDDVRTFLREPRFAVVATVASDGVPRQSVVWYMLNDDDTLSISVGTASAKYKHLSVDARFSLCVEDGYRYATLIGTASFDHDPDVVERETLALSVQYMGPEQAPGMTAGILSTPHAIVRMTVERVIFVAM